LERIEEIRTKVYLLVATTGSGFESCATSSNLYSQQVSHAGNEISGTRAAFDRGPNKFTCVRRIALKYVNDEVAKKKNPLGGREKGKKKKRTKDATCARLFRSTGRDIMHIVRNLYAETEEARDISGIMIKHANFARVFATGREHMESPNASPSVYVGNAR